MINSKKILQVGGLNTDVDVRLMPPTDLLNLENLRASVNQFGTGLNIQNISSTILKYNSYPAGTNFPFGSTVDLGSQRLFWFNVNSNGNHGIYCYDLNVNVTYIVLLSSQTVAGFNWNKSFRIDRNAKSVNGMLIYTDTNNEPQEVNIEAGIKLNQPSYVTSIVPYGTPIPYTSLTLIKRPPVFPLQVVKSTDDDYPSNYIADGSFQFLYYYEYRNNEKSALSAYSPLVPANFKDDTDNYIIVQMPFTEHIDDYILRVSFIVQNGNAGGKYEFHTWDKNNPTDAAAIAAHNAGTTQLAIQFYNDIGGTALDSVFASNNLDNVSLQTKTLEVAKNRLFLANNKKGYNSPLVTSLLATLETFGVDVDRVFKGGSKYRVSLDFKDRYRRKSGAIDTNLYITIPDRVLAPSLWAYHIDWTLSNTNALAEIPDWAYEYQILISKNLIKSFFIEGVFKNASYVKKNIDGTLDFTSTTFSTDNTYAVAIDISTLTSLGIGYIFNEGDQAIIYGSTDTQLRVIGQNGNYVLLSAKDIGTLYNTFSWTLDVQPIMFGTTGNNFYFLPITIDTVFIQPGISVKSQVGETSLGFTDSSSNWAIFISDGAAYTFHVNGNVTIKADANSTETLYVYALVSKAGTIQTTILSQQVGLVNGVTYVMDIDVDVVVPAGYDRICLLFYIGQDGYAMESISGKLSIGQAGHIATLFEIYTPYKQSETEPFYEASDVYPITNPTTNTRQYSALSGIIKGDSYLINRTIDTSTDYITETMSPNDNVWQIWNRDLGWINEVDKIGQTVETDNIDFSDTFISGSKTNGLNKFQALNTKNIGDSTGDIQKLQLANKQQEDGTVMLILTEEQTLSAYLSEVQLVAAAQNSGSPIQSTEVIGTINALKNTRGTINPESVIEYNGTISWWDILHGKVCQYSDDGITDISDFGLKRFVTRYSNRYIQQGRTQIETFCGFSYIASCIDMSTNRVVFTLPQVELDTFQPNLPSYDDVVPDYASSIRNRFDLYDGRAKTIAYNFEENKWKEVYEWLPEWMDYLGNNFYGFKTANLYLHDADDTVFNTIYGVQYPQRICFVVNDAPSDLKDLMDFILEANGVVPDYSVAYVKYPNEQITDLTADNWTDKEGQKYATWFLDRLSPNVDGSAEMKMYLGDNLKSTAIYIMMEFENYDSKLSINFIDIGFAVSQGHKQIENQKTVAP